MCVPSRTDRLVHEGCQRGPCRILHVCKLLFRVRLDRCIFAEKAGTLFLSDHRSVQNRLNCIVSTHSQNMRVTYLYDYSAESAFSQVLHAKTHRPEASILCIKR